MDCRDLVHHGLAVKRLATPETVAELVCLPVGEVARVLAEAEASKRVVAVSGKYTLTPLARVALEARYRRHFAALRADAAFREAYEQFEHLNLALKRIITQWQTVDIRGQRVPNDHSDKEYDANVISELADVHEQVEEILAVLARGLPRLQFYTPQLAAALARAEDGEVQWVSDVRLPSYHTVWFELHEDLLRIMGRRREE